jgi:hypothetical protein
MMVYSASICLSVASRAWPYLPDAGKHDVVAQMNAMRGKGASWATIAATERPGHQILGLEMACQQCVGQGTTVKPTTDQQTRHIVVEETAGVIHMFIPKSDHRVFRELSPETDR